LFRIPKILAVLRVGLFLLAGSLLLSACGFEPLHAEQNGVSTNLSSVRINIITDRSGQILHNHLRDLVHPQGLPSQYTYDFTTELTFRQRTTGFATGLSSSIDQVATYATIVAIAEYKLTNRADRSVVFSGTAEALASYNRFLTPQTNRYSQQDAEERALKVLSEDMFNDLSNFFATTKIN
jgi:LPS-assembly lipoprotein